MILIRQNTIPQRPRPALSIQLFGRIFGVLALFLTFVEMANRDREVSDSSAARIAPRPPHSFPTLLSQPPPLSSPYAVTFADVQELRDAHAALSRRVSKIESDAIASAEEFAVYRASQARDTSARDRVLHDRTVMFARRNAVKAVAGTNADISKVYAALCEKKSVHQSVIRSKAMDCTLLEFRVLARAVSLNTSIQSKLIPSDFHAFSTDASRSSRFEILFPTYRDICTALRIDASASEGSIFTVKRTPRRDIRAVRVLGVDLLSPGNGSDVARQRRVLLGCSFPTTCFAVDAHCLLQPRAIWSENCWESGFEYRKESAHTLLQTVERARNAESSVFSTSANSVTKRAFSLVWEKSSRIAEEFASPSTSPGTLRSNFPAVILRGTTLTSSAQKVFSERIDGLLLNQRLISSPNTLRNR